MLLRGRARSHTPEVLHQLGSVTMGHRPEYARRTKVASGEFSTYCAFFDLYVGTHRQPPGHCLKHYGEGY
jgi:hypothetical protein